MRNCPVCEGDQRNDLGNYHADYRLYECVLCGMRYLDHDTANQGGFDDYYRGDTSPDLHAEDSITRLRALADYIETIHGRALDIGGRWSDLQTMLPGLETLNAGEPMKGKYGLFILSHTLEHVYDVPGLMREIAEHAEPGARVVVEGPYWRSHNDAGYDPFWQHVNKFSFENYVKLLHHYFPGVVSGWGLPDFQMFHCCRLEVTCSQ